MFETTALELGLEFAMDMVIPQATDLDDSSGIHVVTFTIAGLSLAAHRQHERGVDARRIVLSQVIDPV